MEYLNKQGKVFNDNQPVLSPLERAYNKALAIGTNINDWIQETNPESNAYKQKTNAILRAELTLLPFAFANQGIKNALTSGIDYEAARVFNVDDGIKRKFLTKDAALKYLKEKFPNKNISQNPSILPRSEQNLMREEGKKYAKENLRGTSVNIPGYNTLNFTGKNIGKDYSHNKNEYKTLKNDLRGAKYQFSTNYETEPDRLYDHLINPEKEALIDYLSEVIQDSKGNVLHNYKMMKNLSKGDKP